MGTTLPPLGTFENPIEVDETSDIDWIISPDLIETCVNAYIDDNDIDSEEESDSEDDDNASI